MITWSDDGSQFLIKIELILRNCIHVMQTLLHCMFKRGKLWHKQCVQSFTLSCEHSTCSHCVLWWWVTFLIHFLNCLVLSVQPNCIFRNQYKYITTSEISLKSSCNSWEWTVAGVWNMSLMNSLFSLTAVLNLYCSGSNLTHFYIWKL